MTEPDLVPITADDVCFVECRAALRAPTLVGEGAEAAGRRSGRRG